MHYKIWVILLLLSCRNMSNTAKDQETELLKEIKETILLKNYSRALDYLFIKNTLKSLNNRQEFYEQEALSLWWLVLTELNLCPSNLAKDNLGLWTIAAYNYFIDNQMISSKNNDAIFSGLDSFKNGNINYYLNNKSIISLKELNNKKYFSTDCNFIVPQFVLKDEKNNKLDNKTLKILKIQKQLLQQSYKLLNKNKVNNFATIDGAMLMIDLLILKEQEQLINNIENDLSIKTTEIQKLKQEKDKLYNDFFVKYLSYTVQDWLVLTKKQRIILYSEYLKSDKNIEFIKLQVLEHLARNKQIDEINIYLPFITKEQEREKLIKSDFSNFLLSNDNFNERAIIAYNKALYAYKEKNYNEAVKLLILSSSYKDNSVQNEELTKLIPELIVNIMSKFKYTKIETDDLIKKVDKDFSGRILYELAWNEIFNNRNDKLDLLLKYQTLKLKEREKIILFSSLANLNFIKFEEIIKEYLNDFSSNKLNIIAEYIGRYELAGFVINQQLSESLIIIKNTLYNINKDKKNILSKNKKYLEIDERLNILIAKNSKKQYLTISGQETQFLGTIDLLYNIKILWPFYNNSIQIVHVTEKIPINLNHDLYTWNLGNYNDIPLTSGL